MKITMHTQQIENSCAIFVKIIETALQKAVNNIRTLNLF